MEEIFIDSELTAEVIKETIEALFSGLQVFKWDPHAGDVNPLGFIPENSTHILFDVYKESERVEFWWRVSVYRTPSRGEKYRSQLIALTLSAKYSARTLVTFEKPDEPSNPFYVLVYVDGVCYLANDSMFDWGGDENWPDPVELLYPYDRPVAQFDEYGNLSP